METLDPIDQYFPKGDKRRGQALVVNAVGHIEGRKEREAEIIEIINKARKKYYLNPNELKWLIKQIKEIK